MTTAKPDELVDLLTTVQLQHLAPLLAGEDLTLCLLKTMIGEDFVADMGEIGVCQEDAERLQIALQRVNLDSKAPASPSLQGDQPFTLPVASSGRHAAAAAALEKATGIPPSLALAEALAHVKKNSQPVDVSSTPNQPQLPSAQSLIDSRMPSTAPKGLAEKNVALRRYQDQYVDPATRAILEQDRKWKDEYTAEARWRDRNSNPLSWHRDDI